MCLGVLFVFVVHRELQRSDYPVQVVNSKRNGIVVLHASQAFVSTSTHRQFVLVRNKCDVDKIKNNACTSKA